MSTKRYGVVALVLGVSGAWTVAETGLRCGPAAVALAADGQVVAVRSAHGELVPHGPQSPFVSIFRQGKRVSPQSVSRQGDDLVAEFANPPLTLRWRIEESPGHLALSLREAVGEEPDRVAFLTLALAPEADGQGWCMSTVALNHYTNASGLPGRNVRGEATAYRRLGLTRAAAALTVAPKDELPAILQAMVGNAPDLPHSPVGGPWALAAPAARGSYLFAPANVSEETVDSVIELADRLGMNQINLHAVRFGDWQPYPKPYPEGRASLKRVVDRIHAAGMLAGIHTYCYFLNKQTAYVTPKPDPRLGKDATFTLAADLAASATAVPVVESTASQSATTGFFVRNSATVQIGDELIVYQGVSKEAPFGFLECQRGAHGTTVADHARGTPVHHLRECFGLFLPDGDSTLFPEVAANLADMINECGFDMVYLDALDGSDAVAGAEWSWHYAAKFTFELFRHLRRPVLAEMSTFPHHQWFVRSRAGAWDHPVRSHKVFIDTHCQGNQTYDRQLMPTHLGWWQFRTWQDFASEPTYADDIDYLCAKALGHGAGISLMGVTPETLESVPALARLAAVSRRWEALRRGGYFTAAAAAELRQAGAEFTLAANGQGEWDLLPRRASAHRVSGAADGNERWRIENPHAAQPLEFRLEALPSARAKGEDRVVADFAADGETVYRARAGVQATLAASPLQTPDGEAAALFRVDDPGGQRDPWVHWERTFEPPLDLRGQPAMGVWVHGDGKGAVLNIKRQSPSHITGAAGDHYVILDFTGWRWIELVEPEGERFLDYRWPYAGWYSVFRQTPRLDAVNRLGVLLVHLPEGSTEVHLGPVRAVPLASPVIAEGRLTVDGREFPMPFSPGVGQSIELTGDGWLRLLGTKGETLRAIRPAEVPMVQPGSNEMLFACAAPATGERVRAKITVFTHGEPLAGARAEAPADALPGRDIEPPWTVLGGVPETRRWRFPCRREGAGLEVRLRVLDRMDQVSRQGADDAVVLDDFASLAAFADSPDNQFRQYVRSGALVNIDAPPGVTHALSTVERVPGQAAALYTARSERAGGWCARGRRFSPPLDLSGCTHLGYWVRGDGRGEVLYVQLRDVAGRHLDFKTTVDFTGWRYLEFPLKAGEFDLARTEYALVYFNGLPAGQEVACGLDDLRAFTVHNALRNPVIRVNDGTLRIRGELPVGAGLRYLPETGVVGTAADGTACSLTAEGMLPLRRGWNEIEVQTEGESGLDLEVVLLKHDPAAR